MATTVIPSNYVKGHKVQTGVLTGTAIAIAAVLGFVSVQTDSSTPRRAEVVTQTDSGPSSTLLGIDPQAARYLPQVEVPEVEASSNYVAPEQSFADAINAASAAAAAAAFSEAALPDGPQAQPWNVR